MLMCPVSFSGVLSLGHVCKSEQRLSPLHRAHQPVFEAGALIHPAGMPSRRGLRGKNLVREKLWFRPTAWTALMGQWDQWYLERGTGQRLRKAQTGT